MPKKQKLELTWIGKAGANNIAKGF